MNTGVNMLYKSEYILLSSHPAATVFSGCLNTGVRQTQTADCRLVGKRGKHCCEML